MRITYLHQYFNTPAMAGSTRSYELARRLVARGHEVNMITSWRDDCAHRDWFETSEDGIRVHWLPLPYSNRMGFLERIRAFLRFALAGAARAARQPADIVYATSTPLTIALPGAYVAVRRKIPMVFELRDLWPDVPVAMGVMDSRLLIAAARRLETFAYGRANAIVVLTPTMRDFLSGKGVPLHKIGVIPNGADFERFRTPDPDECPSANVAAVAGNPRTLIYCGSLGPAHGPEYLVALAEQFRSQAANVRLLVAGDGKLRGALEETARETGCLDRTITFVGAVPQDDVPELYRRADASIMTMADCELLYRHSVQNKFFDSLAAGKPVFANYAGWASEVVGQAGAGCVVPMQDVGRAARIIAARMEDKAWLDTAGSAARQLASERFDFDLLAKGLEEILEAAAGGATSVAGAVDHGRVGR